MHAATVKLKEQARRHEQAQDWEKAIQAYLEVLEVYDELDIERDLAVYNRVGDLYLRLGRVKDAVHYFEIAADHYGAAGLGNNAIALCSKALRYQPNRASLYRKLAQFSAQHGFRSDARRWFLEFAARMEKAGKVDEALDALSEMPDLADDAKLHQTLARRLLSHGQRAEAVAVLHRAHDLHVRAVEVDAAAKIGDEIAAIDPGSRPGLFAPIDPAETVTDHGRIGVPVAPRAAEGTTTELGLQSIAAAAGIQSSDDEMPSAAGIQSSDDEMASVADRPPAAAPPSVAEPPPAADLPFVDIGIEKAWTGDEPASVNGENLPLIYPDEDGDPEGSAEATSGAVDDGRGERGDAAAILAAADEFAAAGEEERAGVELERGHIALAEAGKVRDAFEVATALARLRPDDEGAFVARVEYASRIPGGRELAEALLSLAEHLEGRSLPRRAAIVYRQLLDIDPANDRARRGLQRIDRGGPHAPAGPDDSNTTRFKLPEKPPSGDDARDFSEMLAEFKRQLAKGLGRDDSTSHYDLGLAFREMGLIDEAITEFQTALRAGEQRLKVYEELGTCFLMSGRPHVAEKVLNRALQLPHETEEELAGIHYLLGRCRKAMGQEDRAAESFRTAAALHPRFADAANRVADL